MSYQDEMAAAVATAKKNIEDDYSKAREQTYLRCNHRKGGLISGFPNHGTADRSVIRHRLPDGGLMVYCTRCGKEWRPISFADKTPATPDWDEAILFETYNADSGSCIVTNLINRTADCHAQIENWCRKRSEAIIEISRLTRCITTLEMQIESSRPTKFYDRVKLAIKILLGN